MANAVYTVIWHFYNLASAPWEAYDIFAGATYSSLREANLEVIREAVLNDDRFNTVSIHILDRNLSKEDEVIYDGSDRAWIRHDEGMLDAMRPLNQNKGVRMFVSVGRLYEGGAEYSDAEDGDEESMEAEAAPEHEGDSLVF